MRLLAALALGLVAAPLAAQQRLPAQPESSYCNVQIDSTHGITHVVQAPGAAGVYEYFVGNGIWAHCINQPTTTMYSDSVAWYPERDLLFLVGRVHFVDTASVLDADRVTYHLRQERLYAEGHVYTKNLHSGSDLRGPNLDYLRAAPQIRDTVELYATGRPTIHFHSARRDTTPPASPTDTEAFVVVADRTHMRGNDEMWGGGHVTVDRSDVAARADSAQLDLGRNVGALIGGTPTVDGKGKDAYHLAGIFVRFALTPEHDIRQVVSEGDALARGPDWRLAADTLDMALDSGKVQRARAWGKHKRPSAVSGQHTIVADSLDIHMPAQIVRLVWAFRNARATSRDTTVHDTTAGGWGVAAAARDSTAPRPSLAARDSAASRPGTAAHDSTPSRPTAAARDAARAPSPTTARLTRAAPDTATRADSAARRDTAAARPTAAPLFRADEDWLAGDSLRADFAEVVDSSGAKKSDLQHLSSFGAARALYHVTDDQHPECPRGVDYSRGSRIDITMKASKVSAVDVVGKTDGVYLEPLCPVRADTTRADSLRGAAGDTTRARADSTRRTPADTTHRAALPLRPAADSAPVPRPGRP